MSRTLKLLTASTAFIAAASAANAVTINTSTTTPLLTSASTPITIDTLGSVITGASSAIEISSTNSVSNTIQVNTGGILQSSATTILSTDNNNALITINNSGTITNAGDSLTGKAIDLTGTTNGAHITNAGTISGSITFGNGTNTFASTNTTSGTITGGSAADTFTFTGATHTGGVDLGAGLNAATVSNSRITGLLQGGAGNDTFNVSNSTITGGVSLGAGTNVLNVSGSTISDDIDAGNGTNAVSIHNSTVNGDLNMVDGANTVTISNTNLIGSYAGGNGADSLTLTNATVSGTLVGGTGGGDILTINGDRTFTVIAGGGGINGFETVNFDTNTILNQGLSGAGTVNIAADKTLTVNNSFNTAAGTVTNNGHIDIAGGKAITTTNFNAGAGSSVGVGLTNSSTIGKIGIANGGTLQATSVTINVGANSGYIASGTKVVLVEDVAAGGANMGNVALLNANTGVYRFSTAVSATTGNVELTIGRLGTDEVVTGNAAKQLAGAIDSVGVSATGSLKTLQSNIGQASSAKEVQNIVDSLAPSIDGAGTASVNIAVDTGNQISNRLASLRGTGVATGDAMASSHMWMQGFGSTIDQDNKGGNFGYDAKTGGMSIGLDTDTLANGVTTGAAVSYARSSVDSKSNNNASTDIDSYGATLYGSRVFDSGIFLNGQLGGGFNKYEMSRNVVGLGTAKGETDGFQGTAKIEAGQDLAAGGFTLTPLASLQYTYLKMDDYTETGIGNAGLSVSPDAMSVLDAGLGGKLAYTIPLTDGGTLKPSVRAKYIYRMGDRELATSSSFIGAAGTSFNTTGVEADSSSVNLGAGLLLTTVGGTDLSLDYDADIRSNLTGHTGQLKARWAF